ncbi:ABC transporter substrate-binding protein [Marisediminicola sp. LYQ134]|uniref:ABC transporter substrate-binding protein n=1 Tax=unclassified Marisediminicola TaxID=2618316 RepID=UPI0039834973
MKSAARRRTLTALVAAASVTLALAACGTTESTTDEDAAVSGGPITITDARGVDVELDGPATRVVGTEWNVVEHLVSLGVMPVGAADVEGYSAWVTSEPLDGDVEDIGTRGEPSIDTIASLDPDLVVATSDLPEAAIAQLEEIVPVIVITSADASAQIERMYDNTRMIAEATGTSDVADEVLAGFETAVADGAAAIEDAGLEGAPVAFSDAYVAGGAVSIRPYVEGSLIASVNEELGLTMPWDLEGDPAYGLAATDVEGLTALPDDVNFVYITNGSEEDDAYASTLAGNAVWESLPFVEAGDVTRLPDGIWMFGGASSMEVYIDSLVDALS